MEPKGLYEPIYYILAAGGKRIRPALTLMACNLYTDEIDEAIAPALGIEVFHNFTLLHDDIMDNADMRRGRETVHKKWNNNTAILSGDAMQILAYKLIGQTPESKLKPVLDIFSQTALEICEGQQLDVDFEVRDNVTTDDYLEMIRLKTAVLLACSLQTGGIIAGANDADCKALYNFGVYLGLAFQLMDDILDVYGDEKTFGKKIGGDILLNKKTYMLLTAQNLAKDEIKENLTKYLSDKEFAPDKKIKAVTDIYNALGVKSLCEDKMKFYFDSAIAELDKIGVDDAKKHELRKLAEKLLYRND
jgi:geranylgeranyl diphosphate synthase type II